MRCYREGKLAHHTMLVLTFLVRSFAGCHAVAIFSVSRPELGGPTTLLDVLCELCESDGKRETVVLKLPIVSAAEFVYCSYVRRKPEEEVFNMYLPDAALDAIGRCLAGCIGQTQLHVARLIKVLRCRVCASTLKFDSRSVTLRRSARSCTKMFARFA